MARFLIVGGGAKAPVLVDALEDEGHVVSVVVKPERDSLAHVAVVVWLSDRSPEGFLLGAIDSSMRGFVYQAGRWETAVSETARRNAIPVAAIALDVRDTSAWLTGARNAIASLIGPAESIVDTLC